MEGSQVDRSVSVLVEVSMEGFEENVKIAELPFPEKSPSHCQNSELDIEDWELSDNGKRSGQ